MKKLEDRIARLERKRRGGNGNMPPWLVVRDGEREDEAWERQLEDYGPPPCSPWPVIVLPEDLTSEEWENKYGRDNDAALG